MKKAEKVEIEDLSREDQVRAVKMARFFPSLSPGHGSQHRYEIVDEASFDKFRCNAKDCDCMKKGHTQSPLSAAVQFVARCK